MGYVALSMEDDGTVVVDWVWSMWEKEKLLEAADLRLIGKFDMVEMERMLMTGLACVHLNHVKRPTVKEDARIRKGETPLPLTPPRKPRLCHHPVLPKLTFGSKLTLIESVGGSNLN
ncbi:hypothetical protein ACFX2J_031783 [Malus domestica]